MDAQNPETEEVSSHLQQDTLLRFRVGPFRFCVPAVEVEGIIIPPHLTRIPLNPPHSKGVFMHHQALASAISLRSKFGLPDNDDVNLGQLILGVVRTGMVGFWVDEVYETVNSSELEWRNMPEFVPHAAFDRFAAKGGEVIMATTMQQLYDVPAEEMASVLAGMQQSFDLPRDLPPVEAQGFDTVNAGDAEDSFGDLTDTESKQHIGGPQSTTASVDFDSETDSGTGAKPVASAVPSTGSPEDRDAPESPRTSGSTTAGAGAGRPDTGSSAVVNLSAHRVTRTANTGKPGNRQSTAQTRQVTHSAARATTGRAAGQYTHARPSGNTGNARAGSAGFQAPERNQHSFSGGAHAGAFNRLNQNRAAYGATGYESGGEAQLSQPYYADNNRDNRNKSGGVFWWLLAAALLVLLFAFWLWPGGKKESISTIPRQNYQPDYSFREQSAPEPVAREPVTSYEAVSPPPAPTERPVTEPTTEAAASPPPVETDEAGAGGSGTSNEVYRLDGEDVTLTVERQRAEIDSQSAGEAPPKEAAPTPMPGYEEFVHIVVKGDTLWDIAAKYLKNPFRYPELARLSEITNPDLIYPGDTVRIRARKNRP